MRSAAIFLFLALAGPGFLTLGALSLRRGWWRESVPLLEVVIDRATGTAILPRTEWDRRFARFQAYLFVVIGAVFSLVLSAAVIASVVPE